ncbi:hypothetical protein FA09DRAFT_329845 [Tilletiopsis washingtonensis]|uniref:DUF2423 domain-containing protein n=1 Tax=Tilletiopsis washingtonensis TaxID=58919 RepID=A0A316Z8W9_9BASI|nr:hypothetical protein FA09DRAFT_329845 [Tilletiopsis washingtonensis]PWN98230.1 hypothetical protein FA09DRAFT_329845 [Tilletiopsis washingtonensis]
MAKSLRSRSKLAARTAKRRDPNSDYAVAEAARTNALAKRQAERIRGKKLREQEAAEAQAEQGDEAEGTMEVDGDAGDADVADEADADAEPVKVSTSGTRESRRETWRKAKGWKPKVGKGTSHEGRSKNNGRVKRRR